MLELTAETDDNHGAADGPNTCGWQPVITAGIDDNQGAADWSNIHVWLKVRPMITADIC